LRVPMWTTEFLKYGISKHFVKLEKGIKGRFPPDGLSRELDTACLPRFAKRRSERMRLEFDLDPVEVENEASPSMEELDGAL